MLDISVNPVAQDSIVVSNCGPFLDPNVGFYCQMLATKNSMKNALGEHNSAILLRWATSMTATALNRCGTPVSLSCRLGNIWFFSNISYHFRLTC